LMKGLGWEPKFGLVDGLESAYGWYLSKVWITQFKVQF
jgi:nucleoside-diphosphate-sugar epimerase